MEDHAKACRLIHEAVNASPAVQCWQIEHIEAGLGQADSGEVATEAEVNAVFTRWR